PFKINFNKLYNSTGNYVTFMLPGLLGGIMQQVIFLAMALGFARDFEDGYFSKLKGVSRNSLYHIALKSAPFLLFIPLMWLIVSRFIPFFNIDVAVYNPAMFVLVALLSLASMMIGMLFSVLIPNQLKATELLMVISTPAFILSGFTWPTMAMPDAIAHIAQYIPLTQFLSGFRKVAVYGGGIEAILPEIKWLVMIALVCFVAIVLALQTKIGWKKREIE
ncbi:MAG: ABC transporter permease, partial [Arenibacter sp.]|nr:ABC transporter permease [Arenibacter sp.]